MLSWFRQPRASCLRLFRHSAIRAASRGLHGRQQQRNQDADDRDNDQEFDERETEPTARGATGVDDAISFSNALDRHAPSKL